MVCLTSLSTELTAVQCRTPHAPPSRTPRLPPARSDGGFENVPKLDSNAVARTVGPRTNLNRELLYCRTLRRGGHLAEKPAKPVSRSKLDIQAFQRFRSHLAKELQTPNSTLLSFSFLPSASLPSSPPRSFSPFPSGSLPPSVFFSLLSKTPEFPSGIRRTA